MRRALALANACAQGGAEPAAAGWAGMGHWGADPRVQAEAGRPAWRGALIDGGTGMDQGRAWIDRLPEELGGQQAIMRRLLTFSEADPDVCWLAIGCSVARGAGDRMSDLDMGIGVRE